MKKRLLLVLLLMSSVFAQAQYTLTINDVIFSNGVITDYINTIEKNIIIPEKFTIDEVDYGITTIGDYAFYNNQLSSVIIPSSVITIGEGAFGYNRLSSVTIPSSVTTIGDYAFYKNQLSSVTIPSSVSTIGEWAFRSNQLSNVTIPSSVTIIGDWTFADNQLSSVTIPSSVTIIGEKAFYNNQLSSVTIPSSVTTIEIGAFYSNQLSSVTIPSSVTTIGKGAFYSNQLSSVTIPSSVTTIGGVAFNNNKIASVNGENSTGIIYARNSEGIDDLSTIVSYGGVADVIDFIPSSVTTIGDLAFTSNELSSVTIPSSVTTIGYKAFYNNQLTSITLPESHKEGFTFINWQDAVYNETIEKYVANGTVYTEMTAFDIAYIATFTEVLGLNSFEYAANVAPNPTKGEFSITFGANVELLNLRIYNLTGQLVYKNNEPEEISIKIDLSSFDNGSYLLIAQTVNGDIITEQIIKK